MSVKYPDLQVQLSQGVDGNAHVIVATVAKAIRREHGNEAAKEFTDAAWECSSYDGLLQLCMRTVVVV